MARLIPPPPSTEDIGQSIWIEWFNLMWRRVKGLEPGEIDGGVEINTQTEKDPLVEADEFLIADSETLDPETLAQTWEPKKVTWDTIKSYPDNIQTKYGDDDDATIKFDSTNLVVAPGTDGLVIQGDVAINSTPYLAGETGQVALNVISESISDNQVRLGNRVDNNFTKVAGMVMPHYTTAHEDVQIFYATSDTTENIMAFGGGIPDNSSFTEYQFRIAEGNDEESFDFNMCSFFYNGVEDYRHLSVGQDAALVDVLYDSENVISAYETVPFTVFEGEGRGLDIVVEQDQTAQDETKLFGARIKALHTNAGDSSSTYGLDVTAHLNGSSTTNYIGTVKGISSLLDMDTTDTVANMYGIHSNCSYGATPAVTATSYGCKIENFGHANATNTYGLHIEGQTGSTNVYGIALDGDGLGSDIIFGEGQDANIYYDGTDLIINPDVVGTGDVVVDGNISLADNDKIKFGTGDDSAIYFDATRLVIDGNDGGGTGGLLIPHNIALEDALPDTRYAINVDKTINPVAFSPAPAMNFKLTIDGSNIISNPSAIYSDMHLAQTGGTAYPNAFNSKITIDSGYTPSGGSGDLYRACNYSAENLTIADTGINILLNSPFYANSVTADPSDTNAEVTNDTGFFSALRGRPNTEFTCGFYSADQTNGDQRYAFGGAGYHDDSRIGIGSPAISTIPIGNSPFFFDGSIEHNSLDMMISPNENNGGQLLVQGEGVTIADGAILSATSLVTNGDFSAGTDWTLGTGWQISGGVLDKYTAGTGTATQTISGLETGKVYALTYTVAGVGGTVSSIVSNDYPNFSIGGITFGRRHIDGTYTEYFRYDGVGSNVLTITPNLSNNRYTIDDVEIYEIQGGDLAVFGTTTTKGRIENVAAKTANYPLVATDDNIVCDTSGGAFTITLPAFPEDGRVYTMILETAGNDLTIDGNGNNINGAATLLVSAAGDAPTLIYNGTQWNLK